MTDGKKTEDMDGYVGFHAALRRSYNCFVRDLVKQCKQLVRHHLESVSSPYSQVCYENDFLFGPGANSNYIYQAAASSICLDLADYGLSLSNEALNDQENNHSEKNAQEMTPGKLLKAGEASMTVPETASPDQPCDGNYVKKEHGDLIEGGSRKRHPRLQANNKLLGNLVSQNGGSVVFAAGDTGSRSGSTYTEICSSAAQHFARIREVLVEWNVTSALNAGFLTPCRERLTVAVRLDLFAVNDEKFMDMFVAPGAIDILQNERQALQKRQKILHSCLTEFKSVATSL